MEIKRFVVGELQENCYLLTDGTDAAIIDPGDEADYLFSHIEKSGATLTKIILTHGHFDHIGAVCELKKKSGAKVLIHKNDSPMLYDNTLNLSYMGSAIAPSEADEYIVDGQTVNVGGSELKILHTPGHSDGSICLFGEGVLFSGDLLFQGSIGRFDHGSLKEELLSLRVVMDSFDDSVVVYPGHGPSTTIGEERMYNPYIVKHVLGRDI